MVQVYDKAQAQQIWEAYTNGKRAWRDEYLDEAADLVEQTRYEASKGRCEVLSLEEAVQAVADMLEEEE